MMIRVLILLVFLCNISIAQVNKATSAQQKSTSHSVKVSKIKDREASYPGGLDSMRNFVRRNLKYPQKELYDEKDGVVIVKCVVWADGHLSDFEIAQGISKDVDAEVIRVVKLMPKWIPAIQNGKKTTVVMKLPVHIDVN